MSNTPRELVGSASANERARIHAILNGILPVSARAVGLRSNSVLGNSLSLSALHTVLAPTLVVSVQADGFATYASAAYTASQIKGAKFIGFEHGGQVRVGHDEEVMQEVANLTMRVAQ